jgi:hypothetical protein
MKHVFPRNPGWNYCVHKNLTLEYSGKLEEYSSKLEEYRRMQEVSM